jgi:hypothetical protein
MNLGIQFHLTGLSLSETVSILDNFGIDRCRSAVHNMRGNPLSVASAVTGAYVLPHVNRAEPSSPIQLYSST